MKKKEEENLFLRLEYVYLCKPQGLTFECLSSVWFTTFFSYKILLGLFLSLCRRDLRLKYNSSDFSLQASNSETFNFQTDLATFPKPFLYLTSQFPWSRRRWAYSSLSLVSTEWEKVKGWRQKEYGTIEISLSMIFLQMTLPSHTFPTSSHPTSSHLVSAINITICLACTCLWTTTLHSYKYSEKSALVKEVNG